MDFGKAFSYPFEDSEWLKKIVIGAVVNLIPIVNFAAMGYAVETLSRIAKEGFGALPEWDDFGKKFMDGLLLVIALFIWGLPGIIIMALGIFPLIMSAITSKGELSGLGAFGLSAFIVIIWMLFVAFMSPAIMMNFSGSRSFSSCFEFSKIFSLVSGDIGSYILGIVAYIAAIFVVSLLSIIPIIGWLLILVGTFYAYLVIVGAFGQILSKTVSAPPETTAGT